MPMLKPLLAGLFAAALLAPSAPAQRRADQDEALAARRAGQVRPLREIEARVIPQMPNCDYLGPEFDASMGIYRLKFLRGGSVIWIDVDGRTGQVVGRSGR